MFRPYNYRNDNNQNNFVDIDHPIINGNLNCDNNKIINLKNGEMDTDCVNKKQLDTEINKIQENINSTIHSINNNER